MTTLVIIEGPGKLTSFRKYLDDDDYRVEATAGHIIDLDEKKMSINFENNFEPTYCIKPGKEKVVSDLKKAYSKCDNLLIASDADREGEFIAYSIAKQLGVKNPKRIRYHDTTKESIHKALDDIGTIDYNLVNAQKLRRLLDRIIGYQVSPILCRSLGIGNLAAGRVMSVVVKLIVEQEKKIDAFFEGESECYFCTTGDFLDGKQLIHATLYTTDLSKQVQDDEMEADVEKKPTKKCKKVQKTQTNEDTVVEEMDTTKGVQSKIKSVVNAKNLMKNIMKSTFKVGSVNTKESTRYPSAPFTTATMLQEASRKLGMSTERTTRAAQKLYEGEYITYIRTDSTNMAETAIKSIGDFVKKEYGKPYHRPINYEVKSKNAQEAHEAIRPTDPTAQKIGTNAEKKIGSDEVRLYNLIWKRAIASQMSPAKFDVTTVKINVSKLDEYFFITQYEKNTFKGFLAVYDMTNVEEDDPDAENKELENSDIYIPKLNAIVTPKNVISNQSYKRPPGRFNEASLVNKLDIKNLGIGRPSTIPTMMKKIQEVQYIVKKDCKGIEKDSLTLTWNGKSADLDEAVKKTILGKDSNRFTPTHLGNMVTDFLNGYFPDIMDYGFTANVEKDLDEVANGNAIWTEVLTKFYETFEPLIKSIQSSIIPKAIMQKDERNLGKDPETNLDVLATTRKHGPVVMLIDSDRKEIKIAPIKEPYTLKKVTLQQALEILEFPKTLGIYQKKAVIMKVGDLGHYIDIGDQKKGGSRISLGTLEKDVASNFDMNDFAEALEKHTKAMEEKNKDILWQNHDAKNKYIIKNSPPNEKFPAGGKYLMVVPLVKPKTNKPPLFVGVSKDIDLEQLTLKDVLEIISKHHEKKKTRGKKTKEEQVEKDVDGKVDGKKPTKKSTTVKKATDSEGSMFKPIKKATTTEKKPTKKKPTKKATDSEGSMFAQHKK